MTGSAATCELEPDDVLAFWFGDNPTNTDDVERCMRRWFGGDHEADRAIRERFSSAVVAAAAQDLDAWRASARGRLALIIVLDQFPRSLHRGSGAAFAHDALARSLTRAGLDRKDDLGLEPLERMFFYMPLEHSESLDDQTLSVTLFERLGCLDVAPYLRATLAESVDYARQHRDIIARFGRFPHRNAALERHSTAEEIAFLAQGGPTFGQPRPRQRS
jgi:uncharacterized protein (DUF924 family)